MPEKKPEPKSNTKAPPKTPKKPPSTTSEDEKKKGKKRPADEKPSDVKSDTVNNVSVSDKLKVYYGPTHESKVTYEAKVIEIDKDSTGTVYLVHYTGWNTRYLKFPCLFPRKYSLFVSIGMMNGSNRNV